MQDFIWKIVFMPLFMFFLTVCAYVLLSGAVCDLTGRCEVEPGVYVKPKQEREKVFCDRMGLFCNSAYPTR